MKSYSIAHFGSSLRNDFDKYSDKDLLIVAEDWETVNKLKANYQNQGWSVSTYTYSKLEYLSKQGNLFVKHLQLEAKILQDSSCKLRDILNTYQVKESYNEELCESIKYFTMLKEIPDSKNGYAWFCDCLYVGLRNYLIFTFANKQVYEFSYLKLLKYLYQAKCITSFELGLLRELRVIKQNYRSNIKEEFPSEGFIKDIIKIFDKLKVLSHIKIVTKTHFSRHTESLIFNKKYNSYQKLRLFEGYCIAKEYQTTKLNKIISNPQFYTCKFKNDRYVMNLLKLIQQEPAKINIYGLHKII